MSTCFCRPSFTHLCHSPVRTSFRSGVHGPLSFTGSQFLCRSPVTEPTSFAGPLFVHGSTNLPRSPVRFPVPLSFTGPRTCVIHRSPLSKSFIGSPFLGHSPVPISFRSLVHGPVSFTVSHSLRPSSIPTFPVVHQFPVGARCVCSDLVNYLQYIAISDVISLLLPPT
jgi:hypothetical protein